MLPIFFLEGFIDQIRADALIYRQIYIKTAKSMSVDTIILKNWVLSLCILIMFSPVAEMPTDYCQTRGVLEQIPGFGCVTP